VHTKKKKKPLTLIPYLFWATTTLTFLLSHRHSLTNANRSVEVSKMYFWYQKTNKKPRRQNILLGDNLTDQPQQMVNPWGHVLVGTDEVHVIGDVVPLAGFRRSPRDPGAVGSHRTPGSLGYRVAIARDSAMSRRRPSSWNSVSAC
jgi:hypothetical protein